MLVKFIQFLLGRNLSWRLGRALYMYSRGDHHNDIDTNGEVMIQRCVVNGWKNSASGGEKLVVFDVGANVGDWAARIIEAVAEPRERALLELHMFEPVPETFRILKDRISKVSAPAGCHYHQLSLSSEQGTGHMHTQGTAGSNSFYSDKAENMPAPISVAKETLPRFCAEKRVDGIHLLKCDTEGHDMEVIKGALPLLKEGKIQVLQFEYNWRWVYSRHYLKDVFDALPGLSYRLGKIQPDGVELYSAWHQELERFFEANYVLIRNDALRLFNTRESVFAENNTLVPLIRRPA